MYLLVVQYLIVFKSCKFVGHTNVATRSKTYFLPLCNATNL